LETACGFTDRQLVCIATAGGLEALTAAVAFLHRAWRVVVKVISLGEDTHHAKCYR